MNLDNIEVYANETCFNTDPHVSFLLNSDQVPRRSRFQAVCGKSWHQPISLSHGKLFRNCPFRVPIAFGQNYS